MTDNEIIKALECHKERELATCQNCPLLNIDGCAYELSEYAFSLINRQKAEIMDKDRHIKILKDDLNLEKEDIGFKKAEIERLHKEVGYWEAETKEARADIDQAVAEAIKEFADKIKADAEWICDDSYIENDLIEYVDNLVKEMVGDA